MATTSNQTRVVVLASIYSHNFVPIVCGVTGKQAFFDGPTRGAAIAKAREFINGKLRDSPKTYHEFLICDICETVSLTSNTPAKKYQTK